MQQQQQPQQLNRRNTASPFPTPSSSPGAISLPPDSEWSGGSEWSLGGSAQSSRAPSPAHPPTRRPDVTRDLADMASFLLAQMIAKGQIQIPQLPSPCPTPAPASESSSSRPASPAVPSTPKKKVPRPANAFMLFRSDMIKKNYIPKTIEQRQQNISRVAGQCWNMMTPQEKAIWHQKAAEKVQEHRELHPNYKFSPERKQSRRKTPPGDAPEQGTEEHIRWIREQYIGIAGPPVPPPRPRKPKSRRGVEAHARSTPPPLHFSLPPSIHPSPAATPEIPRVSSAPPTIAVSPEAHLAAMSAHGILDYSALPPTGPGFPHTFPPEYFAQYITHAAQQTFPVEDPTPRVPTFNDPTQAKFTFTPAITHLAPVGEGSAEADLGLAPPYGASAAAVPSANASTSQQEGPAPSRPTSPSRWDSLDSFLVPPIIAESGPSPHDALNVSLNASSVYGADASAAALDNNELDAWY